jgi:hypothetical protein
MMTRIVRTRMLILGSALMIVTGVATSAANDSSEALRARIERVLAATPLMDGHNDLPWEIRVRFKGDLTRIDLSADTSRLPSPEGAPALMTDIPRMRQGHMGGQFWSVWVPTDIKGTDAVQTTIEQMDLVKAMTAQYASTFGWLIRPLTSALCTRQAKSRRSSASRAGTRSTTRSRSCASITIWAPDT